MTTRTDTLQIRVTTDGVGNTRAELAGVSGSLDRVDRSARTAAGGLGVLGQAFGALSLSTVVSSAVQTIVEFQRLGAVLRTLEGSQGAANARMRDLQSIASQTPAQLQEIVQAYASLKARGLDPTRESLIAFANVASGSGRTIQQFVEAVGDAATGEFERLKDFGIQARQQGEQVAFTFQGVTTVVEKSATEIEGYLRRIGEVQFAGAAANEMQTLGGAASNLKDELSKLAVAIGEGGGLTESLTELVFGLSSATKELNAFLNAANQIDGVERKIVQFARTAAAGITGGAGGIVRAAQAFVPPENDVDLLDTLKRKFVEMTPALQAYVKQQEAEAAAKAKSASESQKLIDKLRDKVATYGRSRAAVLEYEKAQALANITDDASRETVAGLYDELIRKARAEDENKRATREATQAEREAERAMDQRRRTAQAILEAYNPAIRRANELREADEALTQAVKDGTTTTEERARIIDQIKFDQLIARIRALQEEWKAVPASLSFDEAQMRDNAQRAGVAFLDAFADVLLGGDAGDIGRRFIDSIFGDHLRQFIDQAIGRPLAQAIGSGAGFGDLFGQIFGGRSGESAPDFVGPPSALAGQRRGPSVGQGLQFAQGALGVYDAYRNGGGGAGGALQGALSGASAGAAFGPVGAVVGAIVGGLAGLFGGSKTPSLRVGPGADDARAVSPFGSFGVDRRNLEPGTATRVAQGIAQFDRTIASFFRTLEGGSALVDEAREGLRNFSVEVRGSDATLEEILSRRLDAIVAAVEPGWASLLSQIEDVSERVNAFQALYNLRDQVDALDDAIASLGASPVEAITQRMRQLGDEVARTGEVLAAAIEASDPVAIRDAAAAAQQAVIARLDAEISLARQLEAALISAQAAARAADLQIAQRIQATGGPAGLVAGVAQGNIDTLRGLVTSTADPERALAFLSEFVGSVDAWLQASIADVQAAAAAEAQLAQTRLDAIAAQREAINAALQSLAAERDQILQGAAERTRANAERNRAMAQAQAEQQQIVRQIETEALQKQLALAQQFAQVLEQADSLLRDLTYSSTNPLGGFARLDLLGNAITAAEGRLAGSDGEQRAEAAAELLQLLQQRIGLVQGEGLFQRPSGDFLRIYNDTLRRINEVRGIAGPEASRAEQLQAELNTLQRETTGAVLALGDQAVRLTDAEQARLDEIAAEEARLQTELRVLQQSEVALQQELRDIQARAEAQIAELTATARAQYEWARTEGQRLQDERQAAILEQLDALTGGRPVDEFIADRTAEAARLLTDIRDSIRDFLAALADASGGERPGLGPIRGGPPGETPPRIIDNTGGGGGNVVVPITVNVQGGSGDDIGRAVVRAIERNAPQVATIVKRAASTA